LLICCEKGLNVQSLAGGIKSVRSSFNVNFSCRKVFNVKWRININEKNCTGCRICQMICSWANEGSFQPSSSFVTVENSVLAENSYRIIIGQGCKKCGLCATYCTSKALVKERGSEDV